MQDQVKQIMADVLDLDPDSIEDATAMDNTASWDSLNQVNLVIALEQEFVVAFDIAEIEAMLSFADIIEILERKLHS
jgi:acyl carrier protein